jgi:hypothetical protein
MFMSVATWTIFGVIVDFCGCLYRHSGNEDAEDALRAQYQKSNSMAFMAGCFTLIPRLR